MEGIGNPIDSSIQTRHSPSPLTIYPTYIRNHSPPSSTKRLVDRPIKRVLRNDTTKPSLSSEKNPQQHYVHYINRKLTHNILPLLIISSSISPTSPTPDYQIGDAFGVDPTLARASIRHQRVESCATSQASVLFPLRKWSRVGARDGYVGLVA